MIKRPYVICHMLSSLDGLISGSFMAAPESRPALVAYGQLRGVFDCNATLYGTTTMAESYSNGRVGALEAAAVPVSREDFIAETDVKNFIVSVDAEGTLAFEGKYVEKKGRAKAHVIEVLTQRATDDYLAYLKERGISYLFAGENALDCGLMLDKLGRLFGIQRLMVAGGGLMNGSLLREGLIDELSLVLAPVVEGNRSEAMLFDDGGDVFSIPKGFHLKSVEQRQDALWLCYEANDRK